MDEITGYNSAYKGSQIDSAVGTVLNKGQTWDNKQDKVTGLPGQIAGFDDEGNMEAQNPPDTGVTTFNGRTDAVMPQAGDYTAEMVGALAAPNGGTDGQMLYKSADDTVWGDKPVMFVTITITGSSADTNFVGTADKTAEEIEDAVNSGYAVFALFPYQSTTVIFPLVGIISDHSGAIFSGVLAMGYFGCFTIMIDVNGAVSANIMPLVSGNMIGQNGGVAALDDSGKVPASQLPDMDYIPTAEKGTASGVAELDSTGRVPSSQLPSYVDDVLEFSNKDAFPATGEDGKIYVAEDTNITYRWGGTEYVEISSSLALGETSQTAYRGDRGKTAYDHSQTTGNPHNTTAADVGAVPTSTTINGQALTDNINLDAEDVGARPSTWMPTAEDIKALSISGGTLTGPLTLSGDPTADDQAARKAYVDNTIASVKPLTFTNISVTTSMTWGTHSIAEVNEQGFTQRVTVPLEGVTLNHSPNNVNFSVADRYNGNWSDYCDTYDGGLYLYAKEAKAATIDNAIFIEVQ